jgi:hypothetical protein
MVAFIVATTIPTPIVADLLTTIDVDENLVKFSVASVFWELPLDLVPEVLSMPCRQLYH